MIMLSEIIASTGEPLRIVTGDEVAAAPIGWWTGVAFGLLAAVVLIMLVVYALHARLPRDPREDAFRRLAGTFGMSGSLRRLVPRLAQAHGAASPVGLLLSVHAMRVAIEAFERNGVSAPDGKLLKRLKRDFGI